MLLDTIQGVPLGLSLGSIPFLLRNKASFTDIGIFTFAAYPYSLKLFWSPIVDSVYIKSIGRRKSWIIPIQLLVGLIFVYLSTWINDLLAPNIGITKSEIVFITSIFFLIILLVATQDIAVDGWAISLLSEKHRGWASTSQSIGLNIGYFASFTIFLALNSPSFCNSFIRQYLGLPNLDVGIVSLGSYMRFWGIIMIAFTVFLLIFKQEKPYNQSSSIKSVYLDMWKVICLPSMRNLVFVLLTSKLGFIATDNVTNLQLTSKGYPQEMMALSVLIAFPFEIIFPIIISSISQRAPLKSLGPFLLGYPLRLLLCVLGVIMVYTFPESGAPIGFWVNFRIICFQLMYSLTVNMMFVSQCAFFSRISDESIGGTYMTLVNTVANFGSTWPKFIVLFLVDYFTIKETSPCIDMQGVVCSTSQASGELIKETVVQDGYVIVTIGSIILGCLWYFSFKKVLLQLQGTDVKVWRVNDDSQSKDK